jgi:hypothetical protein
MVLRPGRAHCCPGSLQDFLGSLGQRAGRLPYDGLRVIEVDVPAACVGKFAEFLAVHDPVGPGLVRSATLDGDITGPSMGAA